MNLILGDVKFSLIIKKFQNFVENWQRSTECYLLVVPDVKQNLLNLALQSEYDIYKKYIYIKYDIRREGSEMSYCVSPKRSSTT